MWLVQTKLNMSGHSEVSAEGLLKGRKHFSQSVMPMVSVTVSKLGNTDLVLVQPGAKINSVCLLWERIQTRFTAGNSPYLKRLRVQAACTPFTPWHVHCRLPVFQCAWVHWIRKLAATQSGSKSRGLVSVDSVVADGVSSQNFRQWSAATSSDRLLGSAKPGHTEPSDWSAAKKTEDGYQDKEWSCWI